MLDLAIRQFAAFAAKTLLRTEAPQTDAEGPTVDADTTWMPVELALPSRLRVAPEPIVTGHVTDVFGGFGVAKSAIKRWAAIIAAGKPSPSSDPKIAALLERYSKCAYHGLGSRLAGAIRNHPATLRTSHGNGGNKGMGWALDCGHREELTPALVGAGFRSLTATIVECHEATGEVVSVVPHRVWSGKRRVDTDSIVWRAVVLPVVSALGPSVCRVDYELCDRKAGGLPIGRGFDPAALFDDKGRRL